MKKTLSEAAKAADKMEAVLVELIGPVGEKYVAPIKQIIKIESEKYEIASEFDGKTTPEKAALIAERKATAEAAALEAAKARVAARKGKLEPAEPEQQEPEPAEPEPAEAVGE